MSRAFAGGSDRIVMSAGSAPANQGNMTILALVKPVTNITNDHWVAQGYNASNGAAWGLLETSSKFYNEGNFGSGNGTPVLSDWMWIGYGKASGNVKPRWHSRNLTTGGAWVHLDDSANVGDQSGPAVGIVLGGRQPGTSGWLGSIAALVTYTGSLSDAAVEAAAVSAAALKAASPSFGVLFNQTSTSVAVTDLSGNGATQSSISGTSVDADEPPGWSYSLVTGPTVKLWNGSAEIPVTVKLWNGTAEIPMTFDSITT
jgi:hypothetical protein